MSVTTLHTYFILLKTGLDLTLKNGFLDVRLCLNHSWLLVHILFLNNTSFVKTSNKRQCCQLKFNQCIIFIALHPLFCSHVQIINTHGHERPNNSEAMKHLGGPSTIFPNSTVCCSDTPKLYTVISIYPFKEKTMLSGLQRLECSLAKESFFRKFCTIG